MLLLISVVLVLATYGILSIRRPRESFLLLLLGYSTVFAWADLPVGSTETFVTLFDIMFVVLLIATFINIWIDNGLLIPGDRFLLLSIGSFFLVVIGLPLGIFIFRDASFSILTPGLRHIQWFLFLPLSLSLSSSGYINKTDILWILPLIIVPHFTYGILQSVAIHGPEISALEMVYVHSGSRITGLFLEPNKLGFLYTIVALIATPFVLLTEGRDKIADAFVVVICLLGLLLTESRGSIVAYVIAVGIMLIIRFQAIAWGRIVPIVVSVAGVVFFDAILGTPFDVFQRLATIIQIILEGPSSVSSIDARFVYWEQALRIYEQVGFFGGGATAREFGVLTDNYYLVLLIQAGPFGILSILLLYLSMIRQGITGYISTSHLLCLSLCLCVVALAVSNLVYNSFPYHYVQIFLWTMLGLITVTSQTSQESAA